jgi:tetratricopeptide (TPR) repeat protein
MILFITQLFLLSFILISYGIEISELSNSKLPSKREAELIRSTLDKLMLSGKNTDILEYLKDLEGKYGTLIIDDKLPSLYNFRGVSQHNAQLTDESAQSFLTAVTINPNDVRSWINLGESRCHQFRMDEAIHAFTQALNLGIYIHIYLHIIYIYIYIYYN